MAKEVEAEILKDSGKAIAEGTGTAPRVRAHKRKPYMEDVSDSDIKTTVPSFHPPVDSQSQASELPADTCKGTQRTLDAHFATTSKISPNRQAEIDYYLLRFIICCSVAFAILDNRFFIDFLTCM